MGGEGSMQHMINSLRNNKKLLRRKSRFEKEKPLIHEKKVKYKKFKTKKASPELLKRIRKSAQFRQRRISLLYLFVILFGILCIAFFVYKIYKQDNTYVDNSYSTEQQLKENRFLDLIQKGDGWFKEREWDAALFYYNKAKTQFPKKYSINFRIAQTMSLKCEEKYLNCRETKTFLDSLFSRYPNKKDELNTIKKRLNFEY